MKIKLYFFVVFFLLSGLYSKAQDNAIILNLSLEDTQKKLDKALKRNLNPQTKSEPEETKNNPSKISVEEPTSEEVEQLDE